MVDVVSDVVINYKSTGLDKVGAEIKQVETGLDGLVVSATSTEKVTASLENRFKSLERTLSTSQGQADKFAKVQDSVNKAVAQNPELQGRANEVLANAAVKYGQVEKATGALADAHKGLDAQGQAAFHSMRSMVEQLAMGVPITQVLTQQMNHLSFAASGEGGIAGAFKQVGGLIGGMITPMRAVAGGLGAIGVGAAAMVVGSADSFKEMQRSLIGLGARTGTTVQDIKNFAKENASATGLSITQARNLGMEMTKTGEIVVADLHGVGAAVHGFSILTGEDATTAGKKLTQMLSGDLAKAVDDLSKTYSDFNPTIRENVRLLELQGNRAAATQLIIDTIASSNEKAAATTGFWTKSISALGNAYDAIKNKVQPVVAPDLTATPGRVAKAEEHLAMVQRPELGFSADEIKVAREEVAKLKQELEGINTKQGQAEFNDLANKADAATRAIDPYVGKIEEVERRLADLKRLEEAGGLSPAQAAATEAYQNQLQALKDSQGEAVRYNQRVAEIAQRWGDVGQAVALQLQALQNELPVLEAVTGQQRMAAQAAADYANAIDAGKTELEASALSAAKLEAAQASATTSVKQQVEALKDSTAMIKAQQNGTEATTAASIAYKNAIASGADSTAAAALSSATLDNYMAKAATSAAKMADSFTVVKSGWGGWNASFAGGAFDVPGSGPGGGKTGASIETAPSLRLDYEQAKFLAQSAPSFADQVAAAGAGGVQAALAFAMAAQPRVAGTSAQPGMYPGGSVGNVPGTEFETTKAVTEQEILSQVGSLYDLMNQQTTDKAAQATNLQSELRWLQSRPTSIAQQQQIAQLRQSIEGLTKSTDSLNATNQELLSPFYTQDPRTSHIGFRSQGMAAGGYIDVPGSPSANDNMTAIIPVASGERIYVDPMTGRRGAAGSNLTINISSPVLIQGNANKDDVGRTMFQNNQNLAKQLRSAMQ